MKHILEIRIMETWPQIITDSPPKKSEFKVFDSLPHGGAYKTLYQRQKYNDEMYREALDDWQNNDARS